MSRWDCGEVCGFLVTLTLCILTIVLVTHWIWGPKSPPKPFDPREKFAKECSWSNDGYVPNTGSDDAKDWTCTKKQ